MAGNNKTKGTQGKKAPAKTATKKAAPARTSSGRTASGRASSSSSQKNSSKKASGTSRKKSSQKNITSLNEEILSLLILAVAVIFLLSNFGLAGVVGDGICYVMFGLFGVVEYALPLILAGLILMILFNKNISVARIKALAVFGVSVFLSGICSLIFDNPKVAEANVGEFFVCAAKEQTGGGFFGGVITWILSPVGKVGSYVVLVIFLIICLVVVTERSFLGGVRNQGSRVYNTAKTDYENFKEQNDAKRQLYEERRIERQEQRRKRQEQEQRSGTEATDNIVETAPKDAVLGPDVSAAQAPEFDSGSAPEIIAAKPVKARKNKNHRNDEKTAHAVMPVIEPVNNSELLENEDTGSLFEQIDITKDSINTRSSNKAKGIADDTMIPKAGVNLNLHELNAGISKIDNYANDVYSPLETQDSKPRERVAYTRVDDVMPKPVSEVTEQKPSKEPERHETEHVTDLPQKKTAEEKPESVQQVHEIQNIKDTSGVKNNKYIFPPIDLLEKSKAVSMGSQDSINRELKIKLEQTLQSFGVRANVTDITCGPSVTRFELVPDQGVKVSKIVSLSDDIKLSLAATDIRIEAPIPGKNAIGIEVPNKVTSGVKIRELLESSLFKKHSSNIVFAAGKDIAGQVVLADIAKMPHLLIAGATGSGKSVCINTIIMSILYKASPQDVRLIMIDPKVVELSVYNGIPHLLIPVVTDPKKASAALNWAVAEMTDRYNKFAEMNVRDLKGYNEKIEALPKEELKEGMHKMAQIVVIVDELADLMMVAAGEVEDSICRLAQLARAAGIHLVIATQRPSVNVITGVIKANIPSRIAFSVSSGTDSRTIIDMNGAEKLLGKGDMLFYPSGYPKPVRVQGAFVSDKEVGDVVEFLRSHVGEAEYNDAVTNHMENSATMNDSQAFGGDRDSYFADAGRFIIEKEKGSIGMLQRYFKIGFNRAARIMDQLSDAGVVGPEEGTKPRKILMTLEEFEELIKN